MCVLGFSGDTMGRHNTCTIAGEPMGHHNTCTIAGEPMARPYIDREARHSDIVLLPLLLLQWLHKSCRLSK